MGLKSFILGLIAGSAAGAALGRAKPAEAPESGPEARGIRGPLTTAGPPEEGAPTEAGPLAQTEDEGPAQALSGFIGDLKRRTREGLDAAKQSREETEAELRREFDRARGKQ